MRLLVLYLRSRHVPAAIAVAAVSITALGWLGRTVDNPAVAAICGVLAITAAAMAAGPGLAGADPDLERTAAIAWPPRRAAHVVIASAAIAGLALAITLGAGEAISAARVVRDTAGTAGLLALTATAIGASRSWAGPMAWTVLAWLLTSTIWPAPARDTYQQVLSWIFQPMQSGAATAASAILGAAGVLFYAHRGAHR